MRKLSAVLVLLALPALARAQDPQVYTSGSSGKSVTQSNTAVPFINNGSGGDNAAFLARSVKVYSRAASANTCYVAINSTTATTSDVPLAPGQSVTFDRTVGYAPESGWAGIGLICSTGQTATFDVVASRAQLGSVGGIVTTPVLGAAASCTTPPFSFVGDTDTGICESAANVLDVRVGGVTGAQVTSAGVGAPWVFADVALNTTDFASLGAPGNGALKYCSNCNANSNPCTSGGTGAIAKRLNGAWDCR